MALELESLLSSRPGASPCGENNFDDLAYGSILSADLSEILGGSERSAVEGERKEQVGGDWRALSQKINSYFGVTKHLGLAYYATLAETNISGLKGLTDGLLLINQLLSRFWEDLHPVIDEGDPEERVDWIEMLNSPDLLDSISRIAIGNGRQSGSFTLRDFLTSRSSGHPEPSVLEAVINETLAEDPDFYDECRQSVAESKMRLDGIKAIFSENLGGLQLSMAPFEEALGHLARFFEDLSVGAESSGSGTPGEQGGGADPAPRASAEQAAIPAANPAEISSRADVAQTIDRIIRFYSKNEPTSPVPHLLRRVKRVVAMDFLQIIEEFGLSRNSFNAEEIFGQDESNQVKND